ncbi:MAG: hypothetical protein KGL59_08785 [Acidobacteriota bacterium]|nr:hypothetical protein [Acidobacteriota bacterium]
MPRKNSAGWTLLAAVGLWILVAAGADARSQPRASATVSRAPSPLEALQFRNLGPAVAGGRVTAVAGVPDDPNVYYVGTAAGGIFKTKDGGVSWRPLFQHQEVSSVGALALAPSNPNLVWVGTGEANIRNDIVTGRGVYFSPDGGNTWRFMGLGDAGQISSIVVSPLDPDVVFVGVLGHAWGPNPERGVFRTTNGGKTWTKVLYVNPTTGVSDLVMEPGNPKILYAGMWQVERRPWILESGGPASGIYRTTDGGDTWQQLSAGLPKAPIGRIGLAVAPNDPARVYALIESKDGVLWESQNRGGRWSLVSRLRELDARPFYFSHLVVAPDNENKIYFLSFHILESTDGGRTARVIDRGVHADHHSLWIDPRNPDRMIEGNDGGAYISTDGAERWRHLDNIPIEQFYSVAIDSNQTPYGVCGGLQDNGAWCGPTNGLSRTPITGAEWFSTVFGDGQYAVPAAGTPFIYSDSQNGEILRLNRETNETARLRPFLPSTFDQPPSALRYRFNWTAPIVISPRDSKDIYLGANVLFRSTDGGLRWKTISHDLTRNDKTKQKVTGGPVILDMSGAETYDTILSIGISPVDPKVIWVGTDDGLVQVTRDGGRRWNNVTKNIPNLPAWGRISQIGVSPFAAGSAYVAVDFHEMENDKPYVFRTDDFGATWTNITANLPDDAPAHVVREDPNLRGLLVAGTETGLFYSIDKGPWQPIGNGFPNTPVYDLQFEKTTHDLVVATHGRGVFVLDNLSPLEQSGGEPPKGLKLFTPLPATRWAIYNRHAFKLSNFAAPNPPEGAVLDYWLGRGNGSAGSDVEITVTDAAGQDVRTLQAPAGRGFHRVVWNLNYDPPVELFGEENAGGAGPGARAPAVPPGKYRVTLSEVDRTQSVSLEVVADPRSHASVADFREQTRVALDVRDLASSVNQEVNQISALRQQLETLEYVLLSSPKTNSYGQMFDQARALEQTLNRIEEPLYNRGAASDSKAYLHHLSALHDRTLRLLGAIASGYGQRPTAASLEELAVLKREAEAQKKRFDDFTRKDLATFNQAAAAAGVSQLFVPGVQ